MKIIINGRYEFNADDNNFIIPEYFRNTKELDIEIIDFNTTFRSFNGLIRIKKFNRNGKYQHINIDNEYTIDTSYPPYNMDNMFDNANKNIPIITHFDTTDITSMNNTFSNSAFDQDISKWNVINVKNFNNTFKDNLVFKQDISNWKINKTIMHKPESFDENTNKNWKMNMKPWTSEGTFYYNNSMYARPVIIKSSDTTLKALGVTSFESQDISNINPLKIIYNQTTNFQVKSNMSGNGKTVPMSLSVVTDLNQKPMHIILIISYEDNYIIDNIDSNKSYNVTFKYENTTFNFVATSGDANIYSSDSDTEPTHKTYYLFSDDNTNGVLDKMYNFFKNAPLYVKWLAYYIYPIE